MTPHFHDFNQPHIRAEVAQADYTDATITPYPGAVGNDPINPNHYKSYKGLEIIDLTEQLNFNKGNAVKYICRAGIKNDALEIEDLKKAVWYINREIKRLMTAEPWAPKPE